MKTLRGLRASLAAGIAALAVAVAAVAGIGFDGRAEALTNCTVTDNTIDTEEAAFLGLINGYRTQNGLGALSMSTNLNRAATWLGADMGAKRYFSHTDSLGRSAYTRAIDCGYPQGAGENIAAGTNWASASAVFAAWKGSAGHNANMLNGSYKQIGIARVFTSGSPYGWYWVTDFGSTNDGTTAGGSAPTFTPTRAATQPQAATATPTRTPTQPPVATATPTLPPSNSGPASISSPAAGSTLPGASATFVWSPVSGGLEYFIYVGTSTGSNSLAGRSTGTATSTSVTNLPTTGGAIYVRLWTRFAAGWQYRDSTYSAATSGGATSTSVKAAMTSPADGSQLAGTSQAFSWSAGVNAQQYFFYAGTSVGGNNLAGASTDLNRSISVSSLPRGGQIIYVRLWTLLATGWQYTDYTYRAAP